MIDIDPGIPPLAPVAAGLGIVSPSGLVSLSDVDCISAIINAVTTSHDPAIFEGVVSPFSV